jgi:hypothetical protein
MSWWRRMGWWNRSVHCRGLEKHIGCRRDQVDGDTEGSIATAMRRLVIIIISVIFILTL